jgi:hypothetical protein
MPLGLAWEGSGWTPHNVSHHCSGGLPFQRHSSLASCPRTTSLAPSQIRISSKLEQFAKPIFWPFNTISVRPPSSPSRTIPPLCHVSSGAPHRWMRQPRTSADFRRFINGPTVTEPFMLISRARSMSWPMFCHANGNWTTHKCSIILTPISRRPSRGSFALCGPA